MAKKKEPKITFEAKSLEEFVSKANTAVDANWLQTAADASKFNSVKIWTGFYELDMVLYGGIQYGKFFEVFGEDSSGKSLLAMRFATMCLHMCRECVTPILEFTNYTTGENRTTCLCGKCSPMNVIYIDSEDKIDFHWAQVNGWPKKNDPLSKHFYAGSPKSADFLADMTRIAIKNKVLDVLIVDSWAALFPESREGRTSMEQQPGDHAKAIQNLLQSILHENIQNQQKGHHKVTILGINQVRSKIGVSFGNPETVPGGWFLKYIDVGKGRMMAPKTNEGIDKAKMTTTGEHYVDFSFKLHKAAFGVGKGATAGWRVYNRKYGDKRPGETNEVNRMQSDLKNLGIVEAVAKTEKDKEGNVVREKGFYLCGVHFEKSSQMVDALKTPAMQWMVRYAVGFTLATPETRPYIDYDRFNYNPFYNLEVDEDPADSKVVDGEKLPTFTLVKHQPKARKAARKKRGKREAAVEAAIAKELDRNGSTLPASDE